jgi:hypothetical protein
MVEVGIGPEQAEPKSVLTRGLAVARSGVASELRQDRDDSRGEPDGAAVLKVGDHHGDGDPSAGSLRLNEDFRRTISRGPDQPWPIDLRDGWISAGVVCRFGEIDRASLVSVGRHDELSAVVRAAEMNHGRIDVERRSDRTEGEPGKSESGQVESPVKVGPAPRRVPPTYCGVLEFVRQRQKANPAGPAPV